MIDRIVEGVTVATTTSDEASGDTQPSIGELVQEASTQFSAVLHGEIELAKLELRSSVKNAGAGVGLFAGAVVLLVFSLTFGLLALAEGINAAGIWRWAAFLIVFGFLLLLIGLMVFIGIKKVKRIKAPERTIATSKETVAALKNRGQSEA
jgi:uncharacterized membrane protein YqjE